MHTPTHSATYPARVPASSQELLFNPFQDVYLEVYLDVCAVVRVREGGGHALRHEALQFEKKKIGTIRTMGSHHEGESCPPPSPTLVTVVYIREYLLVYIQEHRDTCGYLRKQGTQGRRGKSAGLWGDNTPGFVFDWKGLELAQLGIVR